MEVLIKRNDSIRINNDIVYISAQENSYEFSVSDIDSVKLVTDNIFDGDLSVYITVGETVLIVSGEYPYFDDFLYYRLNSVLPLDEDIILNALAVTDSKEVFVLFEKKV